MADLGVFGTSLHVHTGLPHSGEEEEKGKWGLTLIISSRATRFSDGLFEADKDGVWH